MKRRKSDQERVDRALRRAYFDRETADAGDRWEDAVMQRIRGLETAAPALGGFLEAFERLVWRMAPAVGAAVAVTLLIGLIGPGFELLSDSETFQILYNGVEHYTLLDTMGY